jgi:hypothetical protein
MPADRDDEPRYAVSTEDLDRLLAGEPLEIGDHLRLGPHALTGEQLQKLRAGEHVTVRIFTVEGHRMVVLACSGRGSPLGVQLQTARDHALRAHELLERAKRSPHSDPMLLVEANAHSATAIALGLAELLADADPERLAGLAASVAAAGVAVASRGL